MKDRLFEALKKSSADYAEIRFETSDGTSLAYRKQEVDRANTWSLCGGIVRACKNGGWGVVVFDSLEGLDVQVQEACRCAALVGREKTILAEMPPVVEERPALLGRDFRTISLDEKLDLLGEYNRIILGANSAIASSSVEYMDTMRVVFFANTRGTYFMEERPKVTCAFRATARDGALLQRAHDSVASAVSYEVVLGLEDMAREVAERAVALLRAPKCEGGPQTVILNHRMGGVFIHEAFGHLSEADFLCENPRMRRLMAIGREIGVNSLNVVDEGPLQWTTGSLSFDDEGTPTGRTVLIKDGILAGRLHSLETAGKMGERPTGNARAVRRDAPPIVRMTNTYVENGQRTVQELFQGVDKGIYACDAFGGQTEFEMFTFSAAYGYRVEKGERGELVRDVVLTGNVFETLKAIDGIGNDLRVLDGAGGCGKMGQAPLPVGFGSPHLRIRGVVIGGR